MKKIFVACPIGEENSPTRKRSDQLLKHIISDVATNSKNDRLFSVVRGDQINESGRISIQVLKEIVDCDLMIVDLTDSNPNVLYEFGIRQALVKPYILMAEKGQKLPFDLADMRTIYYQLDLDGVKSAKDELEKQIESSLNGEALAFDAEIFGSINKTESDQPKSRNDEGILLQITEALGKIASLQEEMIFSQSEFEKRMESLLKSNSNQLEQEFGMMIIKQLFEDPEKIEKALPLMEKFQKFGHAQKILK